MGEEGELGRDSEVEPREAEDWEAPTLMTAEARVSGAEVLQDSPGAVRTGVAVATTWVWAARLTDPKPKADTIKAAVKPLNRF